MPVVKKIYIASGLKNAERAKEYMGLFREAGWEITYDWTVHGSVLHRGVEVMRETARNEVFGVLEADILLVVLPGGRGTHVELGVAIGRGTPVLLVPSIDPTEDLHCAFYHHPQVTIVEPEFRQTVVNLANGLTALAEEGMLR